MRCLSLVVLLGLALWNSAPASAQVFKDLLPRVPDEANALVLIHAEKLRESGFARDFVAKTLRGSSQAHKHVIPREDIKRVVLGAELTSGQLAPAWEVAVLETTAPLSFEALQAQGEGTPEALGHLGALKLNTNAYLIAFQPTLYGVFGPANRQKAMRWAERSQTEKVSRLTPYLDRIATYPETVGTEIMLGLDVTGMIDPAQLRENLKNSVTLKSRSQVDPEEVAKVLASVQGIALGVKATDVLNGKLRIDFARSPAAIKDFAKPLLLEKLGDIGLMIDDLESWQVSVDDKTVYLGGELSAQGLRQVLSLIDPPSLPAPKPAMADMPSASELDPMALPSQRYFHEIDSLLTDMAKTDNRKYAKQAGWYDRNARKISQLSMVNVDPELLDYSLAVTTALRTMAYKLRNQAAEAGQYSYNRQTYWSAYGDWYNGYVTTYQTFPSEREKAEKMSKMYGAMSYADTVQTIGNATNEIRRKMVERYKVNF